MSKVPIVALAIFFLLGCGKHTTPDTAEKQAYEYMLTVTSPHDGCQCVVWISSFGTCPHPGSNFSVAFGLDFMLQWLQQWMIPSYVPLVCGNQERCVAAGYCTRSAMLRVSRLHRQVT